jgi:acyl-[acyl-carrier-protein]-phospholipid O-acyltransferase/long-chain-fatty-acid--[acyl-carrier-protein] ligase
MYSNQSHLLKTKRFLPLFLTQFLGAFNDNVFKNALVILITYSVAEKSAFSPQIMVTVAAGIFILPFFIFSAIAGQMADKFVKAKLIQSIKLIEIILMIGASIGFYFESPNFLMLVLFLMGTQSAFFGPVKYGILPDQLHKDELISGNAIIGAGTFVSILLGTILGGLLILVDGGSTIISSLVIMVALIGWACSRFIPSGAPADPDIKVQANIIVSTYQIVQHIREKPAVFRSILGISWFWLFGASFLSQFPTFGKDIIGGNEQVVTLFLAVFSVGIGIGSLFCNKLLKGKVAATYVPLGILGMTVFTIDLFFASGSVGRTNGEELIGVMAFLSTFPNWRILFDLFSIAVCGGIYIVPLYAIMQSMCEEDHRSRTIAGNNVMNAFFMVVCALGITFLLANDFSVTQVFLIIAILNGVVAVYVSTLLPEALVRPFLQWIFQTLYRVEIKGFENYSKADSRTIIVANHLSYIDAALLGAYIPDRVTFAINTYVAKQWWMKPFLFLADTFALDPAKPLSARALINEVKKGQKVVIFPEGRLTATGSLMKIYEGPSMIADKAGAKLLPICITGAQYTPFSRLKGKVRIRFFPKITLTFIEPVSLNLNEELKGRRRRHAAGARLYDVMTNMMFKSNDINHNLFQSLLDAKNTHGGKHLIVEDIERNPLTYSQLITRCFILGNSFKKRSEERENIGILLPNMTSTLICFFGLQAYGRVPAMLNFSAGTKNIVAACKMANIKSVITSQKFIEMGKLTDVVDKLIDQNFSIIYLEDVRDEISISDKIIGKLAGYTPQTYFKLANKNIAADNPAVVLFTSGSEGTPKGVVLSHSNIQANRFQVSSRIDFGPTDIVFNALPIFHSFGLTIGTLLPVLAGMKVFFYPSPLHYRIVPELVYETNATLMFGTDTFLAGYGRYAHPYDFYSIRYVFAGAEKLRDSTRKTWSDDFGVRIFEGYGATETSPVLSMNTPMQNKPGSVGRLMPSINSKLEAVPGIDDGGKLLVSGPNIMKGYYHSNASGEIAPLVDGWYDTGDIVTIDENGYIVIQDRAKRFAKVGGEMVSLTAVENYIGKVWPGYCHLAVQIPDDKKGEQIVVITNYKEASRNNLVSYVKENGLSDLSIPKNILFLDKIPVLGTGKTDYISLREWTIKESP